MSKGFEQSDGMIQNPELKPDPKKVPFANKGRGGMVRGVGGGVAFAGLMALGLYAAFVGIDVPDTPTIDEAPEAPDPVPEKSTAPAPAPEHKDPELEKPKVEVRAEVKPDIKPEVRAPKATFVGDDTYRTSQLNLSGIGAEPAHISNPTEDDVWNFEGAADSKGVVLSNEEAAEALKKGGFVKGGVTYEIWQKDTGEFQLVRCDADHELVGKVPNFDSHPLTYAPRTYNSESDLLTTPAHEEPVEESAQREPRGVLFNGQWVTDEPQYHGQPEVCVEESYDPREVAEVQYLLNRYFPGITDPNFFLHPNPFYGYGGSYGQYMAYEEVQQFILRHR